MDTRMFLRSALLAAGLASSAHSGAQGIPTQDQPTSQQSSQQQQQPNVNHSAMAGEMQDSAPNSGVSGQMMKDKIFLRKAAEGGLAEIQLGQLAAQKGSSQDVRDFGAQMVKDHTDLNDALKPIA